MRAQINPHFLYNTLDSIIWMSEAGETDEVVEMTSALARLLRQSISNDQEEVELEKEIEYVKNYLTIQKMRYKDKLEFLFMLIREWRMSRSSSLCCSHWWKMRSITGSSIKRQKEI